jgi:shikimate dehydrogenase
METYAVFGNPILHSKSPQLFNSVFREMGIDAKYTRVRPSSANDIANIIVNNNLKGANVTTPFKEDVIKHLNHVSNEATEIHGVNTITNQNGILTGYNTDHSGAVNALINAGITLSDRKVLVLGAGPAATAAVYGLKKAGAVVHIANRTVPKAIEIGKRFKVNYIDFDDIARKLSYFDVVVSALLPNANPFSGVTIPGNLVLLDANYRPSSLSEQFKSYGCNVISGKQWLIHQAVEAFKIFTGKTPNVEIMRVAVENELTLNHLKVQRIQRIHDKKLFTDYDLLISASNDNEFKQFLDEEISKTFGS